MDELRKKVTEIVNANPPQGHDIKHGLRVAYLAKKIAHAEGYNEQEAEVAGLLHDIGRTTQKEDRGHGPAGVPIAKELLDAYTDFDQETKERILKAIEVHSAKETEGMLNNILQDADKLDGMGAIGISRAYLSKPYLTDYDPKNVYPKNVPLLDELHTSHDLMAFVLNWYSMLYTQTAKEIGKKRQEFMIAYMEEFVREVEESTE